MLDRVSEAPADATAPTATVEGQALPEMSLPAEPAPQPKPRRKPGAVGRVVKGSIFLIVQIGLMVAVLFAAFTLTNRLIAEKPEPRERRAFKTVYTIDTVTAQAATVQPAFIAYGQTVAARTFDLRSLVGGEVVSISDNLSAGSRVKSGDALVTIDAFEYEGALREAQANLAEARGRISENEAQIALEEGKLEAAREQLAFAVDDVTRAERLRQRGTSTQQQLDARKLVQSQREQQVSLSQDTIKVQQARLEQLRATVSRLEWRVSQAQRNLDSTTLRAPFDGVVRTASVEAGRNVTANDVVVSLYEDASLDVKFTLTDAQYGRLQTDEAGLMGRAVDVTWTVGGVGYTWPATIDRLGADVASARGGVEVFASIGEAQQAVPLRPGAFVEMKVPDRTYANAFVVPDQAIYGTEKLYVAVNGALEERKVTISAFEGENAIVTAGLVNGDEVLTTRITEVAAGLRVRKEGDPDPVRPAAAAGSGAPGNTGGGRPSPELIAATLKANGLSREDFRALPREERRKLIAAQRTAGEGN